MSAPLIDTDINSMARNTYFASRAPFQDGRSPLHPLPSRTKGPFSFLNPTKAHFHGDSSGANTLDGASYHKSTKHEFRDDVHLKWTSRDNRKGRHTLVVPKQNTAQAPRRTSHPQEILKGIWRMVVRYPVWDISWWIAYIFTWGSIIWCINALFTFLPFVRPSDNFPNESLYGGGITAFIGATVFEVGSVLLMLEAVNEDHSGCFGWAVQQVWEEHEHHGKRTELRLTPDDQACKHHHANRRTFLGTGLARNTGKPQTIIDEKSHQAADGSKERTWTWWPTKAELKNHYIHEVGFIACSAQMIGATIFWIAGFTALPGIANHMSVDLTVGVYWVPQIVGGSGFIVSGALFMIETQSHWYKPAPKTLGWWIGFFNLIGGIGFTICPCFGLSSRHWAQYEAGLSTFWASWAFLIGSGIQLYESLEKYPVIVDKKSS